MGYGVVGGVGVVAVFVVDDHHDKSHHGWIGYDDEVILYSMIMMTVARMRIVVEDGMGGRDGAQVLLSISHQAL